MKNNFIDYDERDVYINEEFKKELRQRINRLPNKTSESPVIGFKVPVLFVNGYMLGVSNLKTFSLKNVNYTYKMPFLHKKH